MKSELKDDGQYWDKYYEHQYPDIMQNTLFAEYVLHKWLEGKHTMLECGCGNGRDTLYFQKKGLAVTGVDRSAVAIEKLKRQCPDSDYICADFVDSEEVYSREYDIFYSRFSVHAISLKQEIRLHKNVFRSLCRKGLFCIETRSVNDELYGKGEKVGEDAYVYGSHCRRFIRMNDLIRRLIGAGFSIKYAEENRGFAPLNGSDPQIIRVVAGKD